MVDTHVEMISDRIPLYEGLNHNVSIPKTPKIPLDEGLQVKISGGHDTSDTPKQVLQRCLLGLGTAKAIAESATTGAHEVWANTRIEKGQEVNVYGKDPYSVSSWRRPVDTSNRLVISMETLSPAYDEYKLANLFQRYLPKWEALAKNITLFDGGVNGHDIEREEGGGPIIWENDALTLQIIRDPHLDGYHLVAHPKESFSRQWQAIREAANDAEPQKIIQVYIQKTLEATAVAMGACQLLSQGRGEIHNSGNWAGGLKTTDEGGKLSMEDLAKNPKKEKKSHRPDLATSETSFGTGMHVHVYIPEEGETVVLPKMNIGEAKIRREDALKKGLPTEEYDTIIDQWNKIPSLTPEKIKEIKDKLGNGKLTKWLENNCEGKLS